MSQTVSSPFHLRLQPWLDACRKVRPGTFVFLAAILVRLCVLFRSTDTQHFLPVRADMHFYNDWALRIAGGQWTDHQAFYGMPLYAYLLAALYKLLGYQPYVALILQVLTESATAWLIFRLAPLAFSPSPDPDGEHSAEPGEKGNLIGWIAAAGWIFFVPAQAYSAILMPTTYFVAAYWFVVWWTLRQRPGAPRARAFFVLGAFMGFAAMMVANILLLSGLVLAALFFRRSWVAALPAGTLPRWRSRAIAAGLLFGGIGVGASPCWVHNYFVAGEPVIFSAHGGINFYTGNYPQANGYPKVPDGMHTDQAGMIKDSISYAEKYAGHPLRRYEVSAYWSKKAHDWIAAHPGAFVRLIFVKLGNYWNTFQYDDLGMIIPMQEDGVLLPGPGFGLIALLGLPGMVLAVARRPRARWIAAAVLLHMASLMTVFITERYRLAAAPGLLLLSSYGLVEGGRLLCTRRWVPALAYAAILVAAFFYTRRPVPDPSLLYLDDYNTGVADLENGHPDRARPKLERVYSHNPDNAEAVFAMGNVAMSDKQFPEAAKYYQRALQLDPMHHRAMNNLAVLAMQSAQWEAAQSLLVRALLLAPEDAKADYLLARTRLNLHDADGAREAIETALQLKPGCAAFLALRQELDHSAAASVPPAP